MTNKIYRGIIHQSHVLFSKSSINNTQLCYRGVFYKAQIEHRKQKNNTQMQYRGITYNKNIG
jgi:hypothetical protein